MPLQDLTPQLRTRLNKMEKAVGLFVSIATLTLLALLAYYVYHLAESRGWFLIKIQFYTGLKDATGLETGTPVKLMGRVVGEVTQVELNDPGAEYNVTVKFILRSPYYGYLWTDSKVQVNSDMLAHRWLQIIPGTNGAATIYGKGKSDLRVLDFHAYTNELYFPIYKQLLQSATNQLATNSTLAIRFDKLRMEAKQKAHDMVKMPDNLQKYYPFPPSATNLYFVPPDESPDLMGRLAQVATTVEGALPGILNLTNLVAGALTNVANLGERVTGLVEAARPVVSNLVVITGNLTNSQGSLGTWLIPPQTLTRLDQTLDRADVTMADTDTNLTTVVSNLNVTLGNLGGITSNLNAQVQANTNILASISKTVVDSDNLIQGLKRHWLLRSAFKPAKTNTARPKRN